MPSERYFWEKKKPWRENERTDEQAIFECVWKKKNTVIWQIVGILPTIHQQKKCASTEILFHTKLNTLFTLATLCVFLSTSTFLFCCPLFIYNLMWRNVHFCLFNRIVAHDRNPLDLTVIWNVEKVRLITFDSSDFCFRIKWEWHDSNQKSALLF